MVTTIGLIIVGVVLIVLGYFLPIPSWAKGLLYAVGVIALVIGIIFLILGYTPALAIISLIPPPITV